VSKKPKLAQHHGCILLFGNHESIQVKTIEAAISPLGWTVKVLDPNASFENWSQVEKVLRMYHEENLILCSEKFRDYVGLTKILVRSPESELIKIDLFQLLFKKRSKELFRNGRVIQLKLFIKYLIIYPSLVRLVKVVRHLFQIGPESRHAFVKRIYRVSVRENYFRSLSSKFFPNNLVVSSEFRSQTLAFFINSRTAKELLSLKNLDLMSTSHILQALSRSKNFFCARLFFSEMR